MKTRFIFASLVLAAAAVCSCDEGISTPNTDNKGKEKPTVAVELKDNSDVDFTISLTPSADVQNYAYVIYSADSYEYAAIPSAYDIVTKSVSGTYAAASIIKGDETSKDIELKCILKDYYQICVAAISKDGLLSEVDTMTVHIPGAHPDIEFVSGVYTIDAYTSEDLGDDAFTDGLGGPFDITIYEAAPGVYATNGAWFGVFNLPLVGSYDYSDNTLTFDGKVLGDEASGTRFGSLVGYVDKTVPLAWAIFGGGSSGSDPLVFQCEVADKKATITSVKSGALEIDIYNGSSGSWAWYGIYGYFDNESTVKLKKAAE